MSHNRMSLPLWERGLKQYNEYRHGHHALKSLPLWERGLKLMVIRLHLMKVIVAPFMGAWIETCCRLHK